MAKTLEPSNIKHLPVSEHPRMALDAVAIEAYSQMITLIGGKDTTTRRLPEDILSDEQGHAEELKDWLAN